MIIRQLSYEDEKIVRRLFFDVFTREPWNDDWSDENQLIMYIRDLMGNENSLTFGLFDNDELIGMTLGSIRHWFSATEYYIDELCVKTELQGHGLGTFMLKAVEKEIAAMNIESIYLQTQRSAEAFKFYLKNGFEEVEGQVSLAKKVKMN